MVVLPRRVPPGLVLLSYLHTDVDFGYSLNVLGIGVGIGIVRTNVNIVIDVSHGDWFVSATYIHTHSQKRWIFHNKFKQSSEYKDIRICGIEYRICLSCELSIYRSIICPFFLLITRVFPCFITYPVSRYIVLTTLYYFFRPIIITWPLQPSPILLRLLRNHQIHRRKQSLFRTEYECVGCFSKTSCCSA